MSYNNLDEIFQQITTDDFTGRIISPSFASSNDASTTDSVMMWIIKHVVNITGDGVPSVTKMIDEFTGLLSNSNNQKLISNLFRIHTTYGAGWTSGVPDQYKKCLDQIGQEVNDVKMSQVINHQNDISDNTTMLYSNIFCNSPIISPVTRNTQLISLFMNTIPSHIMSLCVPLMSLEFTFDRLATLSQNADAAVTPGTLKFLIGGRKGDSLSDADQILSKGLGWLQGGEGQAAVPKMTIDSFLCPQTMQNLDEVVSADARYNKVLDPMRPLASINSLSINVNPSVGFMTFKTANLKITLHDRSRLSELADILKPDFFPSTTVWLEYGWSFPQNIDNTENRFGFGDLIRKMKSPKEAYGIKNSSFSFNTHGEVDITIELYTKVAAEFQTLKITDRGLDKKSKHNIQTLFNNVRMTIDSVRRIRKDLNLFPEGIGLEEVRAFQLLNAAEDGVLPELSVQEFQQAMDEIRKAVESYKTETPKDNTREISTYNIGEKAAALIDLLDKSMYRVDKTVTLNFKDALDSSIKEALKSQFDKVSQGYDPYLPHTGTPFFNENVHPFVSIIEDYKQNKQEYYTDEMFKAQKEAKKTIKNLSAGAVGVVSFAKLITSFLAEPLLSLGNEIQCLFYMFNNQAGHAANCNIGEFPVEVPVFLDSFRTYIMETGNTNITLEQFCQIAMSSSVNDPRGLGYGLRMFYEPFKASSPAAALKKKKENDYGTAINNLSRKLGGYVFPHITIFVETVQKKKESLSDANQKITRIHFYDEHASPYKDAEVILRSSSGNQLYTVPTSEYEKRMSPLRAAIESSTKQGQQGLETVTATSSEEGNAIENNFGQNASSLSTPEEIKAILSKAIPTIKYGASNTAILSADVSSKSESLMGSTFMMSAMGGGKGTAIRPNGADRTGIPMLIVPVQLNVTTLGCPLLHPVQQYFFDFSTGTTIDNIYVLTNLSHEIQPGQFSSTATFTFLDAYGKFFGAQTAIDQLKIELSKLVQANTPEEEKKGKKKKK